MVGEVLHLVVHPGGVPEVEQTGAGGSGRSTAKSPRISIRHVDYRRSCRDLRDLPSPRGL